MKDKGFPRLVRLLWERSLPRLLRVLWERRHLTIPAALIVATVLSTGWLIYYKPEYRGRVLDAETGEPIVGAAVVARYYKNVIISFPESHTVLMDERETLTDGRGDFRLPAYLTMTPCSVPSWTAFVIFKPGYGNFPSHSTSPPSLPLDIEERFFSRDFGTDGEVRAQMATNPGWEWRRVPVTFGMVRLPRARTWKERRDACSVSIDFPDKCPVTREMLRKEDEWLSENRIQRRVR